MSLAIQFTNLVFALSIESAPTVTGPWTHLIKSVNPCASIHTLSVNKTKPREFFRFIAHDNGKAPTPAAPTYYLAGQNVRLNVAAIEQCPSSRILRYLWHRNGELVATTTEPALNDAPAPGLHLYQVQVETAAGLSWLSGITSVIR